MLTSVDYREILRAAAPLDVVYMDPPYQGVSHKRDPRYMQGLSVAHFVEALDDLNQRGVAFIVSYDGRTGERSFGTGLPDWLGLARLELDAGRSSQATLLGRSDRTYESLYLSPALLNRLEIAPVLHRQQPEQLLLFGDPI